MVMRAIKQGSVVKKHQGAMKGVVVRVLHEEFSLMGKGIIYYSILWDDGKKTLELNRDIVLFNE